MKKFVVWTSLFAALGVLVPLVLLFRFWVFHHPFGGFEAKLWPDSLIFFGLEAPNSTMLEVVLFYGIAFVGNAFRYAVIGVLTWPIAYLVLRRRHRRTA